MPQASRKLDLAAIEVRTGTRYPRQFWSTHGGDISARSFQRVGEGAGLTSFGVTRVILKPGSVSSLRHWHTHDDEFAVVLEGEAVMITDDGETLMRAGDMAGFPSGVQNGHCFANRSSVDAIILAIGPNNPKDECFYSDVDLHAKSEEAGGGYETKGGTPYGEP